MLLFWRRSLAILFILILAATAETTQSQPKITLRCAPARSVLLKQVKPAYPPEALAKRVQGTVRIEVLVDMRGVPAKLTVLSGPPELVNASLEAVKQWRYKPLRLNGVAVTAETAVEINYILPPKQTASEGYLQRCKLKVLGHAPRPEGGFHIRKGEKPSGYPPVIAFEILESGQVANAWVKRSYGIADIDNYALNWIRGTRYNARPGCGVVESEAGVTIDFTGN